MSNLTTQQRANIAQFRQLMAQAVAAAFQQFRTMGDQMLTYHQAQGPDIWQPIFTSDQLRYVKIEDDTLGSSDQMPFTMAGLPCATLVGNSTYYEQNPPPGSYPYDQPGDTLQLMNIFADGNSQQSQALTLSLALPGMLTTWMLSQPAILGQAPADGKPIAAIDSIGLTQPGKTLNFAAHAAYDPTNRNGKLSYHWDFGDGTSANGQQVSHTYTHAGSETLSLTVTAPDGKTRVITKQLDITTTSATYPNPYVQFLSEDDGMPRSNPEVTLPTANPALSDRVGTVAQARQQGATSQKASGRAAPNFSALAGAIFFWIILLILVGSAAVTFLALKFRADQKARQREEEHGTI